MYRQYENPKDLEERLKEAEKMYADAVAQNADEEVLVYLEDDIEELKQRINFAWQDIWYDEEFC